MQNNLEQQNQKVTIEDRLKELECAVFMLADEYFSNLKADEEKIGEAEGITCFRRRARTRG